MRYARLAATMSGLALLAGCVTDPRGGYNYEPCWQMPLHADGIPQTDMGAYIIDGVWTLSCATAVSAGNGVYGLNRIFAHGNSYHSPDGMFSVELPGRAATGEGPGLVIRESVTSQRDYVVFVPRPTGGAAYSITALSNLPDRYVGMDVAHFSHAAVADLTDAMHSADPQAPELERVYEQQITLDGQPVMFATFRREGTDTGPFYLVYFVEKGNRAAILSVLWPGDSLPTGADPEATIRTMDSGLQAFVNSFHLAASEDKH